MDPATLSKHELENLTREADRLALRLLQSGESMMPAALRPPRGSMFESLTSTPGLGPLADELLRSACAHVAHARRTMLSTLPEAPLSHGRWITFSPDWADFVQLAHDPGFIDESDAPGWCLWICAARSPRPSPDLLSWVPRPLIDRFETATHLSSAGALHWTTDEELAAAVGESR
jgi:hypothetical protein